MSRVLDSELYVPVAYELCFSPVGEWADLAGTAIASQPVRRAEQAPNSSPVPKIRVTIDTTLVVVPAVTLRRTDTTLDLSHKGRKRYSI